MEVDFTWGYVSFGRIGYTSGTQGIQWINSPPNIYLTSFTESDSLVAI